MGTCCSKKKETVYLPSGHNPKPQHIITEDQSPSNNPPEAPRILPNYPSPPVIGQYPPPIEQINLQNQNNVTYAPIRQDQNEDYLTPIKTSCPCNHCQAKSLKSSKGIWKRSGSDYNIEINRRGYVRCPSNSTILIHVSRCKFVCDNHKNDHYSVDQAGLEKLALEMALNTTSKSLAWKEELMRNIKKPVNDRLDRDIMIRIYK